MFSSVIMRLFTSLLFPIAAVILAGCETTNVSGPGGNQEAKRMAAIERLKQQPPIDEAKANLWSAQEQFLDRDGNPLRAY